MEGLTLLHSKAVAGSETGEGLDVVQSRLRPPRPHVPSPLSSTAVPTRKSVSFPGHRSDPLGKDTDWEALDVRLHKDPRGGRRSGTRGSLQVRDNTFRGVKSKRHKFQPT